MSKDYNYMPVSIVTGSTIGAVYGFRHPSEKSCAKILNMNPSNVDTMLEYRDSFDIKKAGEALRAGNLTEDEYKIVNNIRTAIHNAYEKEKQVIDVANTPIEERKISYRQAVKEANATRPKLWKSMLCLNANFKEKLINLNVFDNEKFTAAFESAKSKLKPMYKELAKGSAKFLAVGLAVGTAAGYFLNKISHRN